MPRWYKQGISVWLCLLAAWWAPAPGHAQTMRVHFIDVGQGAATLLEFPCAAVLIDAGGEKNAEFDGPAALIAYLDGFFAGRPDLDRTLASLILTHPHKDHTLGVPMVLANYRVLHAVTNGMETGSGRLGQIALHNKVAASEETADPGDDIGYAAVWQKDLPAGAGLSNQVIDPVRCDTVDPKLTALWGQIDGSLGWNATKMGNANDHSVVLRVDFGKASLLVSGDLEDSAIDDLIKHYRGTAMLDVDVLQVNHHGSYNGTSASFLKATSPDYAVIAMGAPERRISWTAWAYGHPRKQAVDLLQKAVAQRRPATSVPVASAVKTFAPYALTRAIYGTGWDGTVILEADVDGVWKSYDGAASASRLDLNTATVAQLVALPMIGHARANAIVGFRAEHGPFRSVDDLLNIPQIKAGTVSAVRNLVTVRE